MTGFPQDIPSQEESIVGRVSPTNYHTALVPSSQDICMMGENSSNNSEFNTMNSIERVNIKPGLHVLIIMKQDQRSGKTTEGIVKDILTKSPTHPHGIKVRLESGEVGRVQKIIS